MSEEALRRALSLIAAMAGKTLLGDGRYDEGANAAFEQCAAIARDALQETEQLPRMRERLREANERAALSEGQAPEPVAQERSACPECGVQHRPGCHWPEGWWLGSSAGRDKSAGMDAARAKAIEAAMGDDPAGCPGGHGDQCCRNHAACRAALASFGRSTTRDRE